MCCVMACARQNDSTLTMKNKLAEWDAPMSQISSLTTTSDFLLNNIFVTIWRNAGVHLRGDQLFHDLITETPPRSPQYGIVVMSVIDAFGYAPQLSPSRYEKSREFRGLHGRKNPPLDSDHAIIRPYVPSPLPHKTPVLHSLTNGFACRLSKPNIRISLTFEPHHT